MVAVDYEGTAHLSVVPQIPLERFNLIARFGSADAAAAALRCLHEDDPDGDEASWLGYLSDAVHAGSGLTDPDARMVWAVVRDTILGGVVVGIAGIVAGMVVGAIPPLD